MSDDHAPTTSDPVRMFDEPAKVSPTAAEIMRLALGAATTPNAKNWAALEAKVNELAHALDAEIGRNAALRVLLAEAQKR